MYRIIRVDGTEERIDAVPTVEAIRAAIGCDTLDAVSLGKANEPPDDEIMCVDDTGAIDGKPLNATATALYQRVAPKALWGIYGDVVLTYDRYFA